MTLVGPDFAVSVTGGVPTGPGEHVVTVCQEGVTRSIVATVTRATPAVPTCGEWAPNDGGGSRATFLVEGRPFTGYAWPGNHGWHAFSPFAVVSSDSESGTFATEADAQRAVEEDVQARTATRKRGPKPKGDRKVRVSAFLAPAAERWVQTEAAASQRTTSEVVAACVDAERARLG